ncbi:MAG: GatB/YqeY domain-containing protein [Gammaproteobacteria bacterium]|nr:GatB/YqeY domain-containing protein [Gammaproteobacteria bacterium]
MLRNRIQDDMKNAMRAKDMNRLGTIRLLLAAIKQREVDERITLDDTQILIVIDKMIRQRNDSITQYKAANRVDLADKEAAEIEILKAYLPTQLGDNEIEDLIKEAVAATNASTIKDMSKVMAYLKPKVQGRADIAKISAQIKAILN